MNVQLDVLKEQMLACESCDLFRSRTQVVFGEGNHEPLFVLIGESPGETEDLEGKPFVGQAGKKLDSILSYVGVTRDEIYITNSVLCRPPNNRIPRKEELDACHWRLDLQIKLLKPKLIVLLGRTALEQMRGNPIKGALSQYFPKNPGKVGGDWFIHKTETYDVKIMVSFHPSYHLRSPEKAYKQTLPHWEMVKRWVEKEKPLNKKLPSMS